MPPSLKNPSNPYYFLHSRAISLGRHYCSMCCYRSALAAVLASLHFCLFLFNNSDFFVEVPFMMLSDLKMAFPDPYVTYKVLHDLPSPTFLASSPASPLPPSVLNSIQSPKVPARSLPVSAKCAIASAHCPSLPQSLA